jgi:hypothetical protein
MKPDQFPAGTRTGWILVASIAIFILALTFLREYYSDKEHRKSAALAHELITIFHEEFNNLPEHAANQDSDWSIPMMAEVRSRTGKFKRLGSCDVKRTIEPPYLAVECQSTFEAGEEKEIFLFRDDGQDHRLRQYSAVPVVKPVQ